MALGERLEAIAREMRDNSPEGMAVVDRFVARLEAASAGATARRSKQRGEQGQRMGKQSGHGLAQCEVAAVAIEAATSPAILNCASLSVIA